MIMMVIAMTMHDDTIVNAFLHNIKHKVIYSSNVAELLTCHTGN